MNKVLLVGRLTHEPEKRTTSSGITYIRFSIAVSRAFSKEQTDFIPLVAWRQSADYIANYLHKGYLVSVDGSFTSSRYQNKENQPVTRYEVTVDRIQNLEPRRDNQNQNKNIPPVKVDQLPEMTFEADVDNTPKKDKDNKADIPWDIEF